jgi:hypothetical protein
MPVASTAAASAHFAQCARFSSCSCSDVFFILKPWNTRRLRARTMSLLPRVTFGLRNSRSLWRGEGGNGFNHALVGRGAFSGPLLHRVSDAMSRQTADRRGVLQEVVQGTRVNSRNECKCALCCWVKLRRCCVHFEILRGPLEACPGSTSRSSRSQTCLTQAPSETHDTRSRCFPSEARGCSQCPMREAPRAMLDRAALRDGAHG